MRMRVKSSGLARGLANARPPGSATFANAPPPGLTRWANAPQLPGGGSWAQVEVSDALALVLISKDALHIKGLNDTSLPNFP